MKPKNLWLSWLYIGILCIVLGFIPQPDGFVKFLLVVAAIGFFVPPAMLLAGKDTKTAKQITGLAAISLTVTMVLICLNFLSVLMSGFWGNVLHILLVILSCPMICGQYWVLSLLGWASLLFAGIHLRKKT